MNSPGFDLHYRTEPWGGAEGGGVTRRTEGAGRREEEREWRGTKRGRPWQKQKITNPPGRPDQIANISSEPTRNGLTFHGFMPISLTLVLFIDSH